MNTALLNEVDTLAKAVAALPATATPLPSTCSTTG